MLRDISLWQLVSALLVGGRTLLVGQDVVVDVERFLDTLVRGRVTVTQLVPSYLEVVVSYLERHPRALPDLRWVSVTGEALKAGAGPALDSRSSRRSGCSTPTG